MTRKPEGARGGGGKRLCTACQKTWLSRYNDQQICAACVRAARTPHDPRGPGGPGQPPGWLWGAAPMRRALARCDLGAVVAIYRAATGISQQDLANKTGWTQSAISLIETGHRHTLYDIRELLRFADVIGMPREALLPLVLGHPGDHTGPAPAQPGPGGDPVGPGQRHPQPP